MRPCDLNNGLGQLTDAIATLKERWVETKVHWNDDKTQQFEQNYLAGIPDQIRFLMAAAQHLSEVLDRAERDCNDITETY